MVRYKEDLITGLVVLATSLFFVFTPGRDSLGSALQGFIIALIFFGLLPLGYHFLVLKKSRGEFGLGEGAWRSQMVVTVPVIVLALFITIGCFKFFPNFQENFLLPALVTSSFGWFLGYELILVPLLALLYEIFFRAFIQKSWLERHLGGFAVLAQSALFILFLLATGSFGWATFPLMVFSIFAGFLMWQNNSLIQTWVASWFYLLLFDVFLLIGY